MQNARTASQLVPTMFSRMLKLPEADRRRHDLSSLKIAVHAAAPCPAQVKEAMIDWWGPIIHEYYGATEAMGFTACNTPEWLAHRGKDPFDLLEVPPDADAAHLLRTAHRPP